jgi:hypothetical protein
MSVMSNNATPGKHDGEGRANTMAKAGRAGARAGRLIHGKRSKLGT